MVKKLHPLGALGLVTAERGDIRAEYLQERIQPKIPFPHRHDFFQIVIIKQGKGRHEIDFKNHVIRPGSVFLVKPGQVHSWELQKAAGYIVEFHVPSLGLETVDRGIFQGLHDLPESLKISAGDLRDLYFYCEKMREEFQVRAPGYSSALKSYLSILMLMLFRSAKLVSGKAGESAFLGKFENLIELNFARQHEVDFYARELGLSAKALTMRVRRLLGKSAREMIHDRCLLEAQRYLGYTTMPISEIGLSLGFQDPNYFSRFFKAKAGVSPGVFRDRKKQVAGSAT